MAKFGASMPVIIIHMYLYIYIHVLFTNYYAHIIMTFSLLCIKFVMMMMMIMNDDWNMAYKAKKSILQLTTNVQLINS